MSNRVWDVRRSQQRWRRLHKYVGRVPLGTPVTVQIDRSMTATMTLWPKDQYFEDEDDAVWEEGDAYSEVYE